MHLYTIISLLIYGCVPTPPSEYASQKETSEPTSYPEESTSDGGDETIDSGDTGWFVDGDGDRRTEAEGDCDDEDPNISPTASDGWGDGIDQNCDGVDGYDGDGDGYAWDADDDTQDCDDTDPEVYPGADEVTGDGIDQDCNGYDTILCYSDEDKDGYTGYNQREVGVPCVDEEYASSESDGDCDDTEPDVYPGADEYWDGRDTDCDGYPDYSEVYAGYALSDDYEAYVYLRNGSPQEEGAGHTLTFLFRNGFGGWTTNTDYYPGEYFQPMNPIELEPDPDYDDKWDAYVSASDYSTYFDSGANVVSYVLTNEVTGECIAWGSLASLYIADKHPDGTCIEYDPEGGL